MFPKFSFTSGQGIAPAIVRCLRFPKVSFTSGPGIGRANLLLSFSRVVFHFWPGHWSCKIVCCSLVFSRDISHLWLWHWRCKIVSGSGWPSQGYIYVPTALASAVQVWFCLLSWLVLQAWFGHWSCRCVLFVSPAFSGPCSLGSFCVDFFCVLGLARASFCFA